MVADQSENIFHNLGAAHGVHHIIVIGVRIKNVQRNKTGFVFALVFVFH